MQDKPFQKFLEVPKSPLMRDLPPNYSKLSDNSLNFSGIVENYEEIKEESAISDLSATRIMQYDNNPLQYTTTIEMGYMKPLRHNEDLKNTGKRLNSVVEEVDEEDLTNNNNNTPGNFPNPVIAPLRITMDKQRTYESKKTFDSKRTFESKKTLLSSSSGPFKEEKLSVRYNMSPSIANNSLILKPDIKVHGVNFKDNQKSNENYEWLLRRERSSFRGLPSVIIRNHLKFLKFHANIQISILPIVRSIVFVIIDALQAVISIFSCILYIIDCYTTEKDVNTLHFLHKAELVVTLIFTFDLCRHFFEANDKLHFFLKIHTLIDVVAIAPYYIANFFPLNNSLNFLHILQIFKLIRILRLYRLFNDPNVENSDQINEMRFSLEKQLSILLCTVFATLFIFAGLSFELNAIFNETYNMKEINKNHEEYTTKATEDYTFFYAFYLLFQTFLTMGFGDIVPCEASSRLFISLVIIIFSLVIIDQGYKLWDVKTKISLYDYDYKRRDHYLIIGYFTESSVQRMLMEIFKSENLKDNEQYILLVRNQPPSPEMLNLMEKFNSQMSENVVSYLQSSFMKDNILTKANVKHAKAILLMNDPNLHANDNEILMLMNLLQDYNAFIRKIVQINDSRTLVWKESPLSNPWNLQFSPKRLKMSLIVGSIFNKGVITLFNNLMLNSALFIPQAKTSLECQWLMEYSASSMQGIYLVTLSSHFNNKKFHDLLKTIYKAKSKLDSIEGTLIIGIKSFKNIEQNKGNIYLNPLNYRIKSGDQAIVIAKSKETAEFLSFYLEEAVISEIENKQPEEIKLLSLEIETCGIDFYSDLSNEYEKKRMNESEYFCDCMKRHVLLWKTDITSRLRGHILIFADEEDFEVIIFEIRKRTEKPVCFFLDSSPGTPALEVMAKNPLVFLLEGNVLNIEHLKHANINEAFHVLIFTQESQDLSDNLDSKAILLSNILEEFFTVTYTMEISDLSELKLLGFNAKKEFASMGLHFNPHFMAGNVLPSNLVDSLSVYLLEDEILLEVIKHSFQGDKASTDVIENQRLFSISCPGSYHGRKYEDFLMKCLSMKHPVLPLGILTKKFSKLDTPQYKLLRELQNKNVRASQHYNANSPSINSPTRRLNQMYNDDQDPRSLRLPLFLINPLPSTVLNKEDIILMLGEVKREKFSVQDFPVNTTSCDEDFRKGKEKNTEKFKEIVGCLREKMLNNEAIEEFSTQKNEMIEDLEKIIEEKKNVLQSLRNSKYETWMSYRSSELMDVVH